MVEPGRPYFITSQTSPFALTVFSGESVVGYPILGRDNQKWVATQEEDGLWSLKNIGSGKLLSTAGWPRPGVNLIVGGPPTLWQIMPGPEDPDSFSIFIPDSPLNVSLPNNGDGPPAAAVILQDDPIQAWRFVGA